MTIQNNIDPAIVDQVSVGPLCRLKIVPPDKDLLPVELSVIYRVGTLGPNVVMSQYFLCDPDKESDVIDAILR